uniref:TRUD domain-containing protein n=1 Tax=Panagrolaimus sp. ES5 TaxID=591445 RepID=A0AC34FGS7_9BILA
MSPLTEGAEIVGDSENKAAESNTFIFKKHFSDFIVVEKFGENLCGAWPSNLLKPFESGSKEIISLAAPEFLKAEDLQEMSKIIEEKDGKYVVADLNTKENRKTLHLYIRDHYSNMLSSFSVEEGVEVSYVKNSKRDKRIQWPEGLGKFLHFTMKKTDHENSHALNCVSRSIGATSKIFQFAGSKDRRAITYQRISAFKVNSAKFTAAHDRLVNQGIELSEFSYEDTQIKMGGHTSNTFHIILRNAEIDVDRFDKIKYHGCFNIFGPQRFGSVSGNTAEIGQLILHERYEDAVNVILNPDLCVHGNLKEILTKYAEVKRSSVLKNAPGFMSKFNEIIIIRALEKFSGQADQYLQALLQLPRHVRSLYVHAYQSKMFNQFIERFKEKHPIEVCPDISIPLPDHSLNAEEHPEVFEDYKYLLSQDGLTFESFKKHVANFALHLTTRNILLKPKSMTFKLLEHADPDAPFIFYPFPKEDYDYGKGNKSVYIKFELSPGSYATTVLTALFNREFKTGTNETTE